MRILIVDDKPGVARGFGRVFEAHGWQVALAFGGEGAQRILGESVPDVAVLDWNLSESGPSGLDLCRYLRDRQLPVFIIMITGRDSTTDKCLAFELGADDYVTKPIASAELLARAERHRQRTLTPPGRSDVTWRMPTPPQGMAGHLVCGPISVDLLTQHAFLRGVAIDLRPGNFQVLAYLLGNQGRYVTEQELRKNALNSAAAESSSVVRNHIRQLRERLGPAAHLIVSLHGAGYAIRADSESAAGGPTTTKE